MSECEESGSNESLSAPIAEAIEEIAVVAAVESEKEPLDLTASEFRLQAERLELENERLRDENEQLKDVHELRKEYIPKLFWLTVGWLAFVVVIVWHVAEDRDFYLSDNILIALITSTTVNVIGIFVIAARWLFPHRSKTG